jgi:hypothetical protein
MDGLHTFALIMLALSLATSFWRVVMPLASALLVGWIVSKLTLLNTAWFSYGLMLIGLVLGVAWHVKSRKLDRDKKLAQATKGFGKSQIEN